MSKLILDLAKEVGLIEFEPLNWNPDAQSPNPESVVKARNFAELIKQAIYDEVKEELIPDELVNIEPDSLNRQYLKGCNGGVTDALYLIKTFGEERE